MHYLRVTGTVPSVFVLQFLLEDNALILRQLHLPSKIFSLNPD